MPETVQCFYHHADCPRILTTPDSSAVQLKPSRNKEPCLSFQDIHDLINPEPQRFKGNTARKQHLQV